MPIIYDIDDPHAVGEILTSEASAREMQRLDPGRYRREMVGFKLDPERSGVMNRRIIP